MINKLSSGRLGGFQYVHEGHEGHLALAMDFCGEKSPQGDPEPRKKKTTYFIAWNSKQPVFLWLFQLDDEPNLYIKNGCSTKHPLKNGCLVYQEWLFNDGILIIVYEIIPNIPG